MLRQYLQVLRRRWGVLALIVAVSSVSALVVSLRMTPLYQATTQINITPFSGASAQSQSFLNLLTDPTLALQTDVTLIQSDAVLVPAAKKLGLASDDALKAGITAQVVNGTQIIDVQAKSPQPAQAQAWADVVASSFIDFQHVQANTQVAAARADLQQQIAQVQGQLAAPAPSDTASLTQQLNALQSELEGLPGAATIINGGGVIVADATLPTVPVSPKKKQNVLLGAMVGLLLAIGLVLLIEALDDRFRTAEDVEARAGVPALGSVPYSRDLSKPGRAAAMLHQPNSAIGEAYRTLRTNLRFLSVERPLRTLLVTSSVKGEGKSTTAANLAAAFAVSGVRTILVSADLRRPSVHRFFELQNSVGLVDAVLPDVPLERLLQANELPDLRLLAAGRIPPNPTEILGSARFAEVLHVLSSGADLVIIDSPPLLGVADASALASRVDGVVLVVNPGEVSKRSLEHAVGQLRKSGGRLLGTVLNSVGPGMVDGYGYDYDYYSTAEKENRKARKQREKAEKAERRGAGKRRGRRRGAVPEGPDGPGPSPSAPNPAVGAPAVTVGHREAEDERLLAPAAAPGHHDPDRSPADAASGNGFRQGGMFPRSTVVEGPPPRDR